MKNLLNNRKNSKTESIFEVETLLQRPRLEMNTSKLNTRDLNAKLTELYKASERAETIFSVAIFLTAIAIGALFIYLSCFSSSFNFIFVTCTIIVAVAAESIFEVETLLQRCRLEMNTSELNTRDLNAELTELYKASERASLICFVAILVTTIVVCGVFIVLSFI